MRCKTISQRSHRGRSDAVGRNDQNKTIRQSCHGRKAQDTFCPDVRKGEMIGHHLRDGMASDHIKNSLRLVRMCWQDKNSTDSLNQMNPRTKCGAWIGARNNSAACFVDTLEGALRARELMEMDDEECTDQKSEWI